jgi:hypothetical protein
MGGGRQEFANIPVMNLMLNNFFNCHELDVE